MPSIQLRTAALLLRLTRKRKMNTEARAQARLYGPKAGPAPPVGLARRHTIEQRAVAGFTCYTVTPRTGTANQAIVYLHGGAYVFEITKRQWTFVDRLVTELGCRVDVPIYGLAPQCTYKDAYPIVADVYKDLLEHFEPAAIAIAGDSAGAGLGLGFTQTLAETRSAMPGRLIMVSPWLDVSMTNPGIADIERIDPRLSRVGMAAAGRAWAGGGDLTDPRLSPINGSMVNLPPIEVYMGTHDILLPDARKFRDLASAAGARVSLHEVDGAFHLYVLAPVPEGRHAVGDIINTLRAVPGR
jgi:epsilon-lactone hydrolase